MRTLTFTAGDADAGIRVRTAAYKRLGVSKSLLASLKFSGGLLLDGKPVRADVCMHPGQTLSCVLRDEGVFCTPYALPLTVVYQDDDVLIVDKPAPLASAHSPKQDGVTLENAVFAYLDAPEGFVYRPVNRLDKGTSGLMAIALHAQAHDRLQRQLHTPAFVRRYLAVTEGIPERPSGVVDLPIGKLPGESVRRAVLQGGKPCVTEYQTLRAANGRALVSLTLRTGRTHQIRVHMAALGCPLVGDYLYGKESALLPGRFALHACALSCLHPVTGAALSFQSPLPEALARLL